MKKILLFIILFSLSFTKHSFSQVPTGGIIIGPSTSCADVVGAYRVENVVGATEYVWTITGIEPSSIGIDPADDKVRTVIFGSSDVTVTVIAKNNDGSIVLPSFETKVASLPAKPKIELVGNGKDLSITNVPNATYQWYFNNSPISNATARTYTITATGIYEVEVTNAAGCSIKSDKRPSFPTSVKEDAQFKSFAFYPNPITNSKITTNFSEKYDLQFFTLSGKIITEQKALKGEIETELSGVNPGVYLMKIISNNKVANRKIIVK